MPLILKQENSKRRETKGRALIYGDIINVQDQDTPLDVTDTPTKESGNNFWKNLLRTVLGITISIILTFGSNALIHWHRKAKDRKMTAMMVIGNIETFAENLEQSANRMRWNDTLATYLLVIPKDSLDLLALLLHQ